MNPACAWLITLGIIAAVVLIPLAGAVIATLADQLRAVE